MLLLMRREGEAIRINENITIEVRKISEEEVVFELQGINQTQKELLDSKGEESEQK